jgi:hypothetical protein
VSERELLMMHVDALRERSLVAGESGEPRATEQRIVQTLRARRRRKRRAFWAVSCTALALPLASTTYALVYGTPAALRTLLSRVGLGLGVDVSEQRELPRVSSPAAKPAMPPRTAETPTANEASAAVVVPPVEPEALAPAEVEAAALRARSADAPRPAPTRSRAAAARVLVREPAAPAADSGESAQALARGLYARAHELHFIARDADSALRAWDDYLARAPLHPLRIEAEYNRALCLVRLGRDEEALRELTHFADGTHGTYRRREAAALVRALSR